MNTSMSKKVFLSRNQFASKNKWSHGSAIHPYLKAAFWANPANWFWESPHHTEESKAYFRGRLNVLVSDRHNSVKIENAQI